MNLITIIRIISGLAILIAAFFIEAKTGDGWTFQTKLAASVINFTILINILIALAKNPLSKMLADRKNNLEADIIAAQKMRDEATQNFEKLQKKLNNFNEDDRLMKLEHQKHTKLATNNIILEANKQSEKILQDSELILQTETRQSIEHFEQEIMFLSMQKAEQKLKEKLKANPSLHAQLIDDAINKLQFTA